MTGAETFAHPAFLYRGDGEYLAGTLAFVREGVAAGEPVAVAVPADRLALLRAHLDAFADRIRFVDMSVAGRNPARIIPGVLRGFADAHPGRRVRVIGEPVWPGRSTLEYPACVRHEALINLAFAGREATIMCPYDAGALAPCALDDAAATHPVLIDQDGERPSPGYAPERVIDQAGRRLPEPETAESFSFDAGNLGEARAFAVTHGGDLGLTGDRLLDMELAVNELAANSITHGGGSGTLRLWRVDPYFVCEVADAGYITDPLAGRLPVDPGVLGGRGLLLVNQLADLVDGHSIAGGTAIRLYFAL